MKKEEEYLNKHTVTFADGTTLVLTHRKVLLHLRTSFGTSHSSTTVRSNSLIELRINESLYGLGEVGLPPKKPGCYLADNADIKTWMGEYLCHLQGLVDGKKSCKADFPMAADAPEYIHMLIFAMDTCPANDKDYSKAARNGLEGAILDLYAKVRKLPLYKLLGLDATVEKPTFYTVGIAGEEETLQSLHFGLKFSHHIKIKLNKDLARSAKVLDLINKECAKIPDYAGQWSVDLNADFDDPELCLKLLSDVLSKYPTGRFYMMEQPFPVKVEHKEKWLPVRREYEKHGILVFADESVNTADSIDNVNDIVSGINIKLEKCGGHRAALKCVEKAKKLGLKIWIGTMVGSSLLMNMAAALTPAAVYSDMDGELLVTDESQPCGKGFEWDVKKRVIHLSGAPGVGVSLKK